MNRFAKRKDDNQNEIVEALEGIGVGVFDASGVGEGLTDLICFWRGQTYLVEIKDGSKPPSRRRLTPAQVDLHGKALQFGVRIPIVENVAQALAIFGAKLS